MALPCKLQINSMPINVFSLSIIHFSSQWELGTLKKNPPTSGFILEKTSSFLTIYSQTHLPNFGNSTLTFCHLYLDFYFFLKLWWLTSSYCPMKIVYFAVPKQKIFLFSLDLSIIIVDTYFSVFFSSWWTSFKILKLYYQKRVTYLNQKKLIQTADNWFDLDIISYSFGPTYKPDSLYS